MSTIGAALSSWPIACERAEPSPSTSTATAAPTPNTTASAAPLALDSFCPAICRRAAECGAQAALGLASSEPERRAADAAAADLTAEASRCAADCARDRPDAGDPTFAAARTCLAATDCAALTRCLEAL